MSDKRKEPPADGPAGSLVVKRQKPDSNNSLALTPSTGQAGAVIRTVQRVSDLQAPIMLLSGHQVYFTLDFPEVPRDGQLLLTLSNQVLWNAYGECNNYMNMKGHAGAVLEIQWSRDGRNIFSASTDKTVGVWDVEIGERVKKLKGHAGFINSVSAARRGNELITSGGDDSAIHVWDPRVKGAVKTFKDKFPVLAVSFSQDGGLVFGGGIDNQIKAWDMRKEEVVYSLQGHLDTVTGLRLSPDGDYLLSNAMDNTVRIWDVKPFAPMGTRLLKILEGAPHGFEKNLLRPCWSPDGDFVAAGSGDRSVVVWDVPKGKIAYKLPGHKGCVNEVDWTGNIVASASNDKTIFVGELNLDEVK
ncbi:hypothetical protein HK104_000082 [Borealophlyctis nickersoniae]|nr:hypothetical protein HK104_000082 [Borealophlyctis nickersoniae]